MCGAGRPGADGIIPARAGFTRCPPHRRGRRTDHPRSRGVYELRRTMAFGSAGSSPLARGLRLFEGDEGKASRIIPARAGFTYQMSGPQPSSRDHPRSRGVYPAPLGGVCSVHGSSPLARGLRTRCGRRRARRRIIPARAGFTRCGGGGRRRPPDHPRSRGVYATSLPTGTASPGSSPLARGLPMVPESAIFKDGIIPARAGFTEGRA